MTELKRVLMSRDGLTSEVADKVIWDAREAVLWAIENDGDPEEAFTDMTGLEPDYIDDLDL
jgi:hypothetical protein